MKKFIERALRVIEEEIIPETKKGVAKGNKVFGGAILTKSDYSTMTIGVNQETENPLFHGEISTLNKFFAENKNRSTDDLIFLSTHEPCPMCLSAITWAGFNTIYYFFNYQDTKKAFNIAHDLDILSEVFGRSDGAYSKENYFWKCYAIKELIRYARTSKLEIIYLKYLSVYHQYMTVYPKSTKIRKMTIVFRSARYNLRLVYLFKCYKK